MHSDKNCGTLGPRRHSAQALLERKLFRTQDDSKTKLKHIVAASWTVTTGVTGASNCCLWSPLPVTIKTARAFACDRTISQQQELDGLTSPFLHPGLLTSPNIC